MLDQVLFTRTVMAIIGNINLCIECATVVTQIIEDLSEYFEVLLAGHLVHLLDKIR